MNHKQMIFESFAKELNDSVNKSLRYEEVCRMLQPMSGWCRPVVGGGGRGQGFAGVNDVMRGGDGRRWAAATDPSLSWIKLLVSSGMSSSAVTWDQLSSLLALIERLSLPTNPASAATAAGLSLSLLEGRVFKEGRSHNDITN